MERLEKLVSKHHEEHIPLINQYPTIIKEDSSFDEDEDLENGNPRIRRIKRYLKGSYNWKCLEEDSYNTLFKSVVFISSLVWGIIGGVKLYHMYY